MLGRIAREHGLGRQHFEETTESAEQGDFARRAVFMGFPTPEFGQQLHFGPCEGHSQVEEKACGDPTQGD